MKPNDPTRGSQASSPEPSPRLAELLAQRALDVLSLEEQRELEHLLAAESGVDSETFDRAAAALDLALSGEASEPLAPELSERIRAAGEAWIARERRSLASTQPPAIEFERRRGRAWPWIAAAAGFLLALFAWWPRLAPQPVAPTAAELRAALLRDATDVRTAPWQAQADPAAQGASGDVVWSNALQKGFLRIRGLASNDPRRSQYQLWIFDADQPAETPVDGGVFDVAAGEVVIPIDAKLAVGRPQAFAVTVEKPGGVVVSKRERVVLLAPL
jgi:anti-sigma-K factor RskA